MHRTWPCSSDRWATSVAEASDAFVAFGQACGGSDRCSAASVGRPTDATVAFERGVEHTRPRLSVRQTRTREASNAYVVEEVDHWISVAGTRGTCRSDRRYYAAASVAPEKRSVGFQRLYFVVEL
jgi:hypothetical protein